MKLASLMVAGLFALSPLAHAGVTHLNLAGVYNIDGVANTGDVTQTSLDANDAGGNFVFMMQSLATTTTGGLGLADSGSYAATAYHPGFQLGYGANPNGNNVLQFANDGIASLSVAAGNYSEIHVAAMTGGGASFLSLMFHYADGDELSRTALVRDWYDDFAPSANDYYIADQMDRIKSDLSSSERANDPALFGFRFATDSSRQLLGFDFVGQGTSSFSPRLNIFGASAVSADVPEPGSMALMLLALAGLACYTRRKN